MNTVLTILALVPDFLRAAASAFNGTKLATSIDGILNTGASLIEAGDGAATELQAFTTQIKAMVVAGRDPTEEEWNALKARSDTAHALIQGLASPSAPASTPTAPTSAPEPTPSAPGGPSS